MRRGCGGGRGVTASPSPRDSETASAAPSASSGLRTPDAVPGLLGIGSVVKRSTLGRARVPAGPDSGGWAAARGRGCSSARRAGVLFVSQLGGRRSPARRRHAAGNLIVATPRADRRPRARQPLRFQSVVCEPRRDRSLRCSDVCPMPAPSRVCVFASRLQRRVSRHRSYGHADGDGWMRGTLPSNWNVKVL